MIEVKELTKLYEQKKVVNRISFTLPTNHCTALLGPNGAGKTTTIKMMAGLLSPSSGSIHLHGANQKDIRRFIGYLPQHPHFHSWMTGREFLVYSGRLAHLSKKDSQRQADLLLKRVGISEAGNRRTGKYSGGMKQRLGIAQALIHKPNVLMLDEPVSALDPMGRRDILTLMEELKSETTILYSTHILSDAEEMSDEILLMHNGNILESGNLTQVKQRHQVEKISLRFTENHDFYKEVLENIEGVIRVEMQKQTLHVYVSHIEKVRAVLLQKAHEEQWPLIHFEVSQTSLEDLFMKVVTTHAVADTF